MRISISKETLEKVVKYLALQPFKDVVGLISEIEKDAIVIEDNTEEQVE